MWLSGVCTFHLPSVTWRAGVEPAQWLCKCLKHSYTAGKVIFDVGVHVGQTSLPEVSMWNSVCSCLHTLLPSVWLIHGVEVIQLVLEEWLRLALAFDCPRLISPYYTSAAEAGRFQALLEVPSWLYASLKSSEVSGANRQEECGKMATCVVRWIWWDQKLALPLLDLTSL